jgi:ABC-type thiamin/hydroxymethylpyrimidine transport system permease subunit
MPGAIAIVVFLLILPVFVLVSGAVASAVLGQVLFRNAELTHEGSELIELND